MSATNSNFDPRQAVEGLIGYVQEKVAGQASKVIKVKPESQKVEAAVLAALENGSKNPSQIVKAISLASGSTWTPSDGEVSRALATLSAGEMVTAKSKADRKVYTITKSGLEALEVARQKIESEPGAQKVKMSANFNWLSCDPGYLTSASKFPPVLLDLAQTGTKEQQLKAAAILDKARHDLHVILAEK